MQNFLGNKKKPGRKFTRDMAFIRAVVREYETSDLSLGQLAMKHGLGTTQVQKWIAKFSSEIREETFLPAMTEEQQNELDRLKKQNEELLKRLELANLKITGLEMMIDIAEEQYSVDIRKKAGTKQSED